MGAGVELFLILETVKRKINKIKEIKEIKESKAKSINIFYKFLKNGPSYRNSIVKCIHV